MDVNTRNIVSATATLGIDRQQPRQTVAEATTPAKPESAGEIYQISDRGQKYSAELEKNTQLLFELAPLAIPGPADIKQFEQDFGRALQKAGIDGDETIELTTDYDGRVMVLNDHPQKDRIEAMFEKDPELQQQFAKASQARTFQQLGELHNQWLKKIESGMNEQAAGLWLVNEARALTDRAQVMKFNSDGSEAVADSNSNSTSQGAMMAAFYRQISG